MRDSLVRIDPNGDIKIVLTGLGRLREWRFSPTATFWLRLRSGKQGVFRYSPETGSWDTTLQLPFWSACRVRERISSRGHLLYLLSRPGRHASRVS